MLDTPNSHRQDGPVLGDRLRSIRKAQGLSVRSLAQRTGFSPSFLSQVELSQSSPSLGSLQRIADALGVGLADLLAKTTNGSPILRRSRRQAVHSEWSKASAEPLVPAGTDERLAATLLHVDPGGRTGITSYREDERFFAYCVLGVIYLRIEPSEEAQRVVSGDSLLLDGPRRLSWENRSKKPAELFAVTVRFSAVARSAGR
jgi:XRE family transcriptional regulator, regulator of sulfur utilization